MERKRSSEKGRAATTLIEKEEEKKIATALLVHSCEKLPPKSTVVEGEKHASIHT